MHNIGEFLTAIHIYAEDARQGKTRYVEATHYCSHVRKGAQHYWTSTETPADSAVAVDLRQCLIYDSGKKDARLIGIEYMVPKHVYDRLPAEEQKLW